MYDDAYTRNEDGELAVRTVNVTEGSNSSSYDDVFTRDTNGKLALRVTGGGSGDSHNKGYFTDLEALQEAYPTGEAGDWAILESTDTVWIWDSDNSEWVDSDKKGQVTSVNNQTGAVTIGANDILPSQTGYSGRVLGTDGFVTGWIVPEQVQRSTMPQASEDELGNIYQFTGTTDANYTNGYFYKCVSDGQQPATYSWSQVSVQPAPDPLPSQTGNSGKFLTTDGTSASWSDKPLVNSSISSGNYKSLSILADVPQNNTQQNNTIIGVDAKMQNNALTNSTVVVGHMASGHVLGVSIGYNAKNGSGYRSIAIGSECESTAERSIAIGASGCKATASRAIQLGAGQTNNDADTFKVANSNGNFEIMSADGTVPTARLTKVNTTITLASADWSSNTQTVNVTGMTATGVVFVNPDPTDQADYTSAGILCTAQGAGTLTFTCDTTPSNDIDVVVIML